MTHFSKCLSFFILVLLARTVRGNPEQIPLAQNSCKHPQYTVHLFSKAPLVIYISGFLTSEERYHLQEVT
jgi:prolyl 4-hydroxylase